MSVAPKSEKQKQYQAEYKATHRENHAAYMKDYVAQSPTVQCPCGGRYKMYCAYKHHRTSKHLKFMNSAEASAKTAATSVAPLVVVDDPPLIVKEVVAADFIDTEQLGSLLKLKPKKEGSAAAAPQKKRVKKVTIQEGVIATPPLTEIHNICA